MTTVTRPEPTESRSYSFPAFEQLQLSNGMRVIVAPVHKLPLVTVSAIVDAGATCDPLNLAGLSHLTALLLTEGAGSRDGAALSDYVESLGSSVSVVADWDCALVTLSVVSERFGAATDVLGDVLTQPLLPEREFERLKAERMAELLQLRTEPRALADECYNALLYDSSSRFSRPLAGSERSVGSISLSDARDFHRQWFTPSTTTLVVVGDITGERAMRELERVFGSWRAASAARMQVLAGPRVLHERVHLIGKEAAPQSELRIGLIGPPRLTPDYFDAVVMNAVLGGLFSSRINLNLRERHGYTYGASSRFDWMRARGPFVVATAVKSEVTVESITEILGEIDRIRSELVSEDELSLALDYLSGVFPIRFETTAAIASALAAVVIYGLPADYYDRYRAEIRGVSRERVRVAAERHLNRNELRIVVVGDPAVVTDPLEKFAAGPIGRHAADGDLLD